MSVGIGLHDGHDLRAADRGFEDRQVAPDGCEVDDSLSTSHGHIVPRGRRPMNSSRADRSSSALRCDAATGWSPRHSHPNRYDHLNQKGTPVGIRTPLIIGLATAAVCATTLPASAETALSYVEPAATGVAIKVLATSGDVISGYQWP